ncbi:raffinose/stachyose/melibiose transport system substrate-binding protein [Aquamicrobium lusatiense]|uniref:Raffinose/stachyose/melibiose transport system substrate-binding protein n=1 Tax=Aquamicrobium lusatiense TaxID=89772 RepID=A0A7W9VV74_9HYPH|nr:ABC transporter substrate-binding protein [Aquamicrobium lusatiense]MBB6011762.1 raffinose/stachyose/melibiose transport system substrate-binding protein [Aquamicrobium lusatiense]
MTIRINMTRRTALAVIAATAAAGIAGSAQAQESITYWSMWNSGEPQQKVIQKAIDSFTRDTGIDVKVQWIGRDNLKKLAPTLNSPVTPADLVDGAQRNVRAILVSTGSQSDLSPVFESEIPGEAGTTVASVFPDKYLDFITAEGAKWLVPYEVITSQWWYDAAFLPEVEKAPPKNWADFVAFLDKAKEKGVAPLALDGDISNFNLYYFAEIAVRHLGPGKLREAVADPTGEALKDPRILETAKQIEALVKGGYFAPGYNASKWPAMQQLWATNKAAVIFNGPWIVSETTTYAVPGFKPRSFPMPDVGEGAHQTQEVSFIGFAIPKKAANQEAAQKFISYFLAKDRLAGIATDAKNLTPRADIAVPDELAPAKQAIETSPEVHSQFDGLIDLDADYTGKVLIPLVNELIFGVKSAQEFQDALVENTVTYRRLN